MIKLADIESGDLAGIYKEVASQIGVNNAYKLYCYFRGQQITFPIKFYSSECVAAHIIADYDGSNIRAISRNYGYSESRIRQILSQSKQNK